MRFAIAFALVLSTGAATACPRQSLATDVSTDTMPATTASCFTEVESSVRRVLEISYSLGTTGSSQRGVGSAASMFASLDLAYLLQFGGEPDQPSYEIQVSAGAAGQRFAGAIEANGLVTRAGLRFGPARIAEAVIDDGRANFAAFPMTMEIAHAGELAARPRISSRPEVARGLYGRERVELATRIIRVEGAGKKAADKPPSETPTSKPSSWALDVIPLHGGLDVAIQNGTRLETVVGGAMLGVVEHSMGAKLDLLGVESRRIDTPMTGPRSIQTVWMLRLDAVDPKTNTGYMMGWGELLVPDDLEAFAHLVDPEEGRLTIGGAGWFAHRSWGGFGAQYKREPYMTMMGEIGLEDRVAGEVYMPRLLNLVAKAFGARTKRLVGDELVHDFTTGIELDASYTYDGWRANVGLELGRTFYTALDNQLPTTTGFVAAIGLTLQYTNQHAWRH